MTRMIVVYFIIKPYINFMSKETELKFLLEDKTWIDRIHSTNEITQGYIFSEEEKSVRIRVGSTSSWITVKGKITGITRPEFEYKIPKEDGLEMIRLFCESTINKIRYLVNFKGKTWEIDVFSGNNIGLVVAEVELSSELEEIELPPWVGKNVTKDPKYLNANLIKFPFSEWETT